MVRLKLLLVLSLVSVSMVGGALPISPASAPAVPALARRMPPLAQAAITNFDAGEMGIGAPGTTQSYQHTLTNSTPQPKTFSLTADSSRGFSVAVSPMTVTLGGGQSTQVDLDVSIPAETDPGILDITTLTAVTTSPGTPITMTVMDTTLASTDTTLAIPPMQPGQLLDGTRVYTLSMQHGTTEFWPGVDTPTSGYNGSFLGPTLVMTDSETVLVNVTNNLTETTTNHWHGFHLPGEMDGGPHQGIEPGTTWQPTWTINNDASTLWYHPHPHAEHHGHGGTTGTQVWQGLAGMAIIRDAESNALGLPQTYGVDEFPIVLQDRTFLEDGSFDMEPSEFFDQRKGDAFLINGTLAGHLDAPAQMVRLRLLNGSNFRFFNIGFSDNRPFYQIASDNALLNAPVQRTRALIAPGERVEIVVDLSTAQGQTIHFANYSAELGDSVVPNHTADGFDRTNFILFSLNVGAPTDNPITSIPPALNDIVRIPRSAATIEHRLTLTLDLENSLPTINGLSFDMEVINITSTLDTVEVWSIINRSDDSHPIHIHGSPFQILVREAPLPEDGQPLPPGGVVPPNYELGWKDTVIVRAGERVDVIKGVYDYVDPESPFMFHCHLLEHEDEGMMGQYIVGGPEPLVFLPLLRR